MGMKNKPKRKKRKGNVIVSFKPEYCEKLKVVCEAKFQTRVGYIRMIVLPVLEKDFKEVEKCSKK